MKIRSLTSTTLLLVLLWPSAALSAVPERNYGQRYPQPATVYAASPFQDLNRDAASRSRQQVAYQRSLPAVSYVSLEDNGESPAGKGERTAAPVDGAVSSPDRNRLLKAIEECNRRIELRPEAPLGYVDCGDARESMGEHDMAIHDYTKAIEVDPRYVTSYIRRALVYARIGEEEKALEDLTKAIELNPGFADAYAHRGALHLNRGEYDSAIKDFDRYIEINPGNPDVLAKRMKAYEKKREPRAP